MVGHQELQHRAAHAQPRLESPIIHVGFNESVEGMRAAMSGAHWYVDASGQNSTRMMFARHMVFIDAPVTLDQTVNRLVALCTRIGKPGRIIVDCADRVAQEYGELRLTDFLQRAAAVAREHDFHLEVLMPEGAADVAKLVKKSLRPR